MAASFNNAAHLTYQSLQWNGENRELFLGKAQSFKYLRCKLSLQWRQTAVARGHRQTVFLPNNGAGDNARLAATKFRDTLYHLDLLVVLLAKVGRIGLQEVEQAIDHGRYALEMAGTKSSFQALVQALELVRTGHRSIRVDIGLLRDKDGITTNALQSVKVVFQIQRIGRKVSWIVELGGVHVDAGEDDVIFGPCFFDQCEMPLVQGTHGGNKADSGSLWKAGTKGLPIGQHGDLFYLLQTEAKTSARIGENGRYG